jgi:hypothetical protein
MDQRPIKREVRVPLPVAILVVVLCLGGATWWAVKAMKDVSGPAGPRVISVEAVTQPIARSVAAAASRRAVLRGAATRGSGPATRVASRPAG